jgi:hypothetical protein
VHAGLVLYVDGSTFWATSELTTSAPITIRAGDGAGAQCLNHEERIPLGLTVKPMYVCLLERVPDYSLSEECGLFARQSLEINFREASQCLQASAEVVNWVLTVDFLTSRCSCDEQTCFRLDPQQIVEKLERLAVPLLQVVGDEEERFTRRLERCDEGVEETLTLFYLRTSLRRRQSDVI